MYQFYIYIIVKEIVTVQKQVIVVSINDVDIFTKPLAAVFVPI